MASSLRRMLMLVSAALIFWTLPGVAQQSPGKWNDKYAALPEPGEEFTNTVLNGKLYLIGGNSVAPTPGAKNVHPRRLQEYDLATDKWTKKQPVPFAGDHMTAAAYKDKIYVFGGTGPATEGGPNTTLAKTWEYTAASDSWKELAPMPLKRTAAVSVELGGRMYVIGGNSDALTVGTNDVFDPATNKWESKKPMPTARNHPAAGVVNGKIYVIGGRIAAPNVAGFLSANVDVVEEYDPATDAWKPMNRMPTARSGQGWATGNGKIYVAGGEMRDYHGDSVFRDVEVFDPAANEWLRLPPMPTARHGVNVAFLNNKLFVIGGHLVFAAGGSHALDATVNEVFEFK